MSSDQKLDEILIRLTRIETALAPDPGKPSRVTMLEDRVDKLELWRSMLAGAWGVIVGAFAYLRHR